MRLVFSALISLLVALALYTATQGVRNSLLLSATLPTNQPAAILPNQTLKPTSNQEETSIKPTPTPTPTPKPSPTPSPSSTSQPPANETWSDQTWIYPNAQKQIANNQRIKLTTSADPDTVSNWYENRFQEENFPAISLVKNNVNGIVKHQLSAANDKQTIEITIERYPSDSLTTIWLKLK